MTTDRVLADFSGTWEIARTITPHSGPVARFEGTACWVPSAQGLDCVETGTLRVEGTRPMQAERRFAWAPDLSVYFDDGRFFHKIPPRGGRTQHFCDPDTYVGTYDFSTWPDFCVTWDVQGPRKDYQMFSVFKRRADL